MKKINPIIIFVCLTMSTTVFSQGLSLGVRGGVNVANFSINLPSNLWPADNQKQARTSFNLGVYGQYSLNEKMALQAELFYSGEGVRFTDPGTEAPGAFDLSYLSLPLFFKYTLIKNFYVMAGPQFSYLMAANCTYQNGDVYDVLSEHNKINIAVVPVLGYDWKNFSLHLRYQAGLSKLPSADSFWGYSRYADDQVKSNVFSVVVGYKLFSFK